MVGGTGENVHIMSLFEYWGTRFASSVIVQFGSKLSA